MNRAVIFIVAAIAIAIGVFALNTSSGPPAGTATAPVEFEGMDDMNMLADLAQPVVQGNPEARIRIIEFGDYGCPACAGFYSTVKPQIELAYGSNDEVAFVYYDMPIMQAHPHAFVAARAARCAGDQGMYWEYHGALFDNQQAWSLAASTPLGTLESYAADIGADEDQFSSCLRSDAHAEVVTANLELARNLGVTGTPTVMVADGSGASQRLPNQFAPIQQVVDAALGEAGESGDAGAESGDEGGQ